VNISPGGGRVKQSYCGLDVDFWMGTAVVGDWEYRILRFTPKRRFLSVEWTGEVGMVDKLGLEDAFSGMVDGWFGPALGRAPVSTLMITALDPPRNFCAVAFGRPV
jgi:hypothetical protein